MQTAAATIRFALWCAAGATVVAMTGPNARAVTVPMADGDRGAHAVRDHGLRAADLTGRLDGDLTAARAVPAPPR